MFEQSSPTSYSYDYAPAAEPLKEGDPFYDYEIKGWKLGPRIYKILGVSAIVNLILFAIIVQGSLLTMKGCDSPVVGRMCEVLDTVYVGSMLFGTDREYVDAAYDKTDLGDVDITYIDVSGQTPPLEYPAGYFAISNPEKYTIDPETGQMIAALPPTGVEGFPGFTGPMVPFSPSPSTGDNLFNTKPKYPKQNPNVLEGPLPGAGGSGTVTVRKPRRSGRPITDTGDPTGGQTGEVKPSPSPSVEPTAPVTDVVLNKKPWTDWADEYLQQKDPVDLNTPFEITAFGKLTKDGKFDPKSFVYGTPKGDPRMIAAVKDAIERMNESGFLQYLTMFDVKNLTFRIVQDDANVTAQLESQFDNELRPKTVQTLLGNYINQKKAAKMMAPDASQNDKDDLLLLSNAAVMAQGKKVLMQFTVPKANVQEMIQRKLAERKAEPKPANGSGAVVQPTQNTSQK